MDTKEVSAMDRIHEIAETLRLSFNGISGHEKELAREMRWTHPTLQQNLTRFCVEWLKVLADPEFRPVDGRNRESVEFARSIREQLDKAYFPFV